jgi:predicted transcriptional regulator
MIRCPVCNSRFEIAEVVPLTSRQQDVRRAVEQVCRDSGRPAKTAEIAGMTGWSVRTVRYELAHLENLQIICRMPGHPKSGWLLKKDRITLVRVA